MKYSLGISNFVEEISSLSHSVLVLYFFALSTEEGFLISPCCSLELCIQMLIFFAAKYGEKFYSQQKQDRELTVAQIMNSLLPDSD